MQTSIIIGNETYFSRLASNGVILTPTIVAKTPAAASDTTTPSAHTLSNKAEISDSARAAEAAKAAADVSKPQGLPDGKYDLVYMSPQQLYDVTNDMILNKNVDPAAIKGLTDLIGSPRSPDYNSPVNFSQKLVDLQTSYLRKGDGISAAQIGILQTYLQNYTFTDPTIETGVQV